MGHFYNFCSPYLEMFLSVLLKESLFASLVFIFVWLLTRSSHLRSPRIRLGLWGLVLLRLVLPPNMSAPWSFSSLFANVQPAFIPDSFHTLSSEQTLSTPVTVMASTPGTGDGSMIWWILSAMWLLGFSYFLIRFYRSRSQFHRILRQASPVTSPEVMDAAARWRNHFAIRRPIRVLHSNHTISPFTMGSFKPCVYLPSAILEETPTAWEPALAHELAHVKRWDDLWIQALAFLKALYFFNPLVWVSLKQCHHERERLCDRMVIRKGGMEPAVYGKGLLDIFSKQLHVVRELPALSPAAKLVAERLTSLHQYAKGNRVSFLGPMIIIAIALFVLPMASVKSVAAWQSPVELSWVNPLPEAKTSSAFGFRKHPFSKERAFHKGVDLVAPKGAWVHAPAAGVIVHASANYEKGDQYGTVIVIRHNQTYTSLFSHLDAVAVRPGQKVAQGTRLGTVGETGQATAPHLHFELWENESPINPMRFLEEKNGH